MKISKSFGIAIMVVASAMIATQAYASINADSMQRDMDRELLSVVRERGKIVQTTRERMAASIKMTSAEHTSMQVRADALYDLASHLLVNGADPNYDRVHHRKTALMWACDHGDARMVELLLHYHADPNMMTSNRTRAIHYAAMVDDEEISLEIVKLLLDHGANGMVLNRFGTAAMRANSRGHTQVVELIAEHDQKLEKIASNSLLRALGSAHLQLH